MDCATCTALFDSRVCEDALDAGCQVGSTCTGCGDGDGRADGVSCDEIAAYSYFGASAAAKLLETVRLDPTCGEPDLVVEGVTLEVAQAEAILDVANRASQAQLDDEAGLDGRAAANIVASRPLASIEDLAAVSYVGGTALGRLRDYVEVWVPPDAAPVRVTVDLLDDEAVMNGTSSTLYDALVTVERAIVTSDPWRSSSGNTSFYVADPAVGAERQLKVYLVGSTEIDASWVSIFDDVELTGRFTTYGSTFEILLDREDAHAVTLNRSGVAWEDYDRIQGAWHSTSANPEGSVRVVSTWGYTYMVPLPVFLDHPMWGGDPPGPPRDSGNEQDHNWNIAAQAALDAWR